MPQPSQSAIRHTVCLIFALLASAAPLALAQESSIQNDLDPPAKPAASSDVAHRLSPAPSQAEPTAAGTLPKGRKTVVALDIGHTLDTPGCVSAHGRTEYSYNKEVAERIASRLNQSQTVAPFVINPSGLPISLRLRAELAKKHGAELFLSVHHDAAQPKYLKPWMVDGKRQLYSEDFRGYGVFVSEKNPFPKASRAFGTLLGQEMARAGFQFSDHHNEPIKGENRPILDRESGLYRYDDLIVLKSARMPAALLECGVIIHPEEARILAQSDTQEKIAEAVTVAVEKMVAERKQTTWQ